MVFVFSAVFASLVPAFVLEAWFAALGEGIEEIHLSDNNGRYDDHLPLGVGTVDWEKADQLYRRLVRKIPLTFEVGGIEGVQSSLRFLKRNGLFYQEQDPEPKAEKC